jgi:hypothetical protein
VVEQRIHSDGNEVSVDALGYNSGEQQVLAYCPYRDANWQQLWSAATPKKLAPITAFVCTTQAPGRSGHVVAA